MQYCVKPLRKESLRIVKYLNYNYFAVIRTHDNFTQLMRLMQVVDCSLACKALVFEWYHTYYNICTVLATRFLCTYISLCAYVRRYKISFLHKGWIAMNVSTHVFLNLITIDSFNCN